MSIYNEITQKREEILSIASKHGARNVRLFGSVVRGEDTIESDIDFLVDTSDKISPWSPVELVDDLEKILGKKVQIVTEKSLYWLLKRSILKEAKPL